MNEEAWCLGTQPAWRGQWASGCGSYLSRKLGLSPFTLSFGADQADEGHGRECGMGPGATLGFSCFVSWLTGPFATSADGASLVPGSCWSSPASCFLCSQPSKSTRRARRARSTSW